MMCEVVVLIGVWMGWQSARLISDLGKLSGQTLADPPSSEGYNGRVDEPQSSQNAR